jgi:threonine dehydratase
VAGLEAMKGEIEGKTVICILSGSNNDISRLPEVRVRSLIYENKQAYYMLTSTSSRTPSPTQSTSASSSNW